MPRKPIRTLLLSLLLAGCASPASLDLDEIRPVAAADSALKLVENNHPDGIREMKVGFTPGSLMKEIEVGKMRNGYLVKVTWTNNLQLVHLLCANSLAGGCQQSEMVPPTKAHLGYRRQLIVIYAQEGMSDMTLKITAHEICHAVASSQGLEPDPCHNENSGRI